MKYIAPLLLVWSFVCLTSPDGFAVWLEKTQIVSVLRGLDCATAAQAKITLGNGTFVCVIESRDDVIKKLGGA